MTTSAPRPEPIDPLPLLKRLRETVGVDLQEVAGATVTGEIPIAATALNRLIGERLQASDTPVESVMLEPLDGNVLIAHVRLRARIVPPLRVEVRIDQQPELPDRPVLSLKWTLPGLGLLAAFAGPALAAFNAMPRGIRASGEWIGIDVFELMRARRLDELIPHLAGLHVTTRQGQVVVRFQVRT